MHVVILRSVMILLTSITSMCLLKVKTDQTPHCIIQVPIVIESFLIFPYSSAPPLRWEILSSSSIIIASRSPRRHVITRYKGISSSQEINSIHPKLRPFHPYSWSMIHPTLPPVRRLRCQGLFCHAAFLCVVPHRMERYGQFRLGTICASSNLPIEYSIWFQL